MEKSTKNMLIAAGAGLAVGAIAGVLFAPAKGTETRAAIGDKYSVLKDKIVESD
jgi:gas vesicle protein